MQPHSMAALKVAHAAWFYDKYENLNTVLVGVEYQNRDGRYETKYYKVEIDLITPLLVKVDVSHSQGSTRCTVSVRRNSPQEGSKVWLEHSEHHASGLVEELNLYEKNFKGDHRNSLLYKNFSADSSYPEKMVMHTDVKSKKDDSFRDVKYEVEIKSAVINKPNK